MATRLRYYGFFSELGFRVGSTVNVREMQRSTCSDKAAVVEYLRAGSPVVVVPGYVSDPLSESSRMVLGGGSVLTDGEWVWPQIAADFVSLYNVAVPNAFLQHMNRMRFVARTLSADEIRKVFALSTEALSVEPLLETPLLPRLVILDVREVRDRVVDCIARSDGGLISAGQDLQCIGSDSGDLDLIRVEMIFGRHDRIPHLPDGQTAKVTLTGTHVAQFKPGTVLMAM